MTGECIQKEWKGKTQKDTFFLNYYKQSQKTNDKLGENIYDIYIKRKTDHPIKRS